MSESSICLELEIEAGRMLELKTAQHAICFSADNDKRGEKANDLELLPHLVRRPHPTVLCFQRLSTAMIAVDLLKLLTADGFCCIGHAFLLGQ